MENYIEKIMQEKATAYRQEKLSNLYKIRNEKKAALVKAVNEKYQINLPTAYSSKIVSFLQSGNVKVGKSVKTFSLLAGCKPFHIAHTFPDGTRTEFDLIGTCNGFCSGCFDPENPKKSSCYVIKSYYYYPSVLYRHAINTACLYTDIGLSFDIILLDMICAEKQGKKPTVRWHASGEFYSLDYITHFNALCKACPRSTFYTYTKNAYGFKSVWDREGQPENLSLNVSVWHDCCQKAYLDLLTAGYSVKTYIFVDREKAYDYKPFINQISRIAHIPECNCPAYAENGRMDHDFPCEKCKLCCFVEKNLVIYCNEH